MTIDKDTENLETRRTSDKKIIELEQDHIKIQAQLEKIDDEITTLIRTMAKDEVSRIERFQTELRGLESLFNNFKDQANTTHNDMATDIKAELTYNFKERSRHTNYIITFISGLLIALSGVAGMAYDRIYNDIEKNYDILNDDIEDKYETLNFKIEDKYRVLSNDDSRDYKLLNDEIIRVSNAILVLTKFMSEHQEKYIPVGDPQGE